MDGGGGVDVSFELTSLHCLDVSPTGNVTLDLIRFTIHIAVRQCTKQLIP